MVKTLGEGNIYHKTGVLFNDSEVARRDIIFDKIPLFQKKTPTAIRYEPETKQKEH